MALYCKRPVVVEAFRWTGGPDQTEDPQWIVDAMNDSRVVVLPYLDGKELIQVLSIKTLEGTMIAKPGDYIIKGVKGELYPCKPDIFHATYEEVVLQHLRPADGTVEGIRRQRRAVQQVPCLP